MDNVITRRDFLKMSGAAAVTAAAASAGVFNLEKIGELFNKDPEASAVLRVTVGGTDYYLPMYGGDE